ncbi:MAG: hypothetical protein L6Q59_08215 [Ignavibacteriaceae bacterium]|nr:hypothetical protein [Ignavibacteriaceae bacterium]
MRKLIPIILIAMLVCANSLTAQSNYLLTKTTGTYQQITNGINFKWYNQNFLDNTLSWGAPIGFQFNYNGTLFDSVQAYSNGYIRMGYGNTTGVGTQGMLNSLVRGFIAPLMTDLVPENISAIQYVTTGTAPNRVFTVDFKGVKIKNASANSQFQIKLYETTNVIEFIYGTMTPAASTEIQIGLSDLTPVNSSSGNQVQTNRMFNISLGRDSLNPSVHESMSFNFQSVPRLPVPGTVFRFTQVNFSPIPAGTYSVGPNGQYKTISEVATNLNVRGIAGPVVFELEGGIYDDILHLSDINGTSQQNTITIRPAQGAEVTLKPTNGNTTGNTISDADNIIRFSGVSWVTLQDIKLLSDTTVNSAKQVYENGIFLINSLVSLNSGSSGRGCKFNTFKNISLDLNASQNTSAPFSYGVFSYNPNTNLDDSTYSNSYNTFTNLKVEDFSGVGVYFFGLTYNNPGIGNKITGVNGRSFIGIASPSSQTSSISITGINAFRQIDLTIENTDISDINATALNGGLIYGININNFDDSTYAPGGIINLRNNKVSRLTLGTLPSTPSVMNAWVAGISIQRVRSGTVTNITGNEIYGLRANAPGTQTSLQGIRCASGHASNPTTNNIFNNVIYDLISADFQHNSFSVNGISVNAPGGGSISANVDNNTVFFGASEGSQSVKLFSACLNLSNPGNGTITIRNNIFINNSQPGTSGEGNALAVRADDAAVFDKISAQSNNNIYWVGTPGLTRGVSGYGSVINGTLEQHIIALFNQSGTGNRDYNAIYTVPDFINSSVIPYYLKINSATPSQANSAAIPVAGLTTDKDGNARSATTPDIGAYEFAGIDDDKSSPLTDMNALPVLLPQGQTITFKAYFKDRNGVAQGQSQPRVYYKTQRMSGYLSETGTPVSSDTLQFTVNPVSVNAQASDTLYIYVASQDNNGTPNGGTYPYGGSGSNPPGSVAPATTYLVVVQGAPLAGDYTVGLSAFNKATGKNIVYDPDSRVTGNSTGLLENGQPYEGPLFITNGTEAVYATISQAVNEYRTRGISGNTNFILVDTGYVVNSQLDLTTLSQAKPNANARLRIKPGAGVNAAIRGEVEAALFRLGDSFIEIDGSNSGASTRNLRVFNTKHSNLSNCVLGYGSDLIIKNISFTGPDSSLAFGVQLVASRRSQIINNSVEAFSRGIVLEPGCDSVSILRNNIGSKQNGKRISTTGILVQSGIGFRIEENSIISIAGNPNSNVMGIQINFDQSGTSPINGLINRNVISDIYNTSSTSATLGSTGIHISANNSQAYISVTNNVISDIRGSARSSIFYSPRGIVISSTGQVSVINNSIRLAGELNTPSGNTFTAGIMITGAPYTGINLLNNIISNRLTNTGAGNLMQFGLFMSTGSVLNNFDFNLFDHPESQGRMMWLSSRYISRPDSLVLLFNKGVYSFLGEIQYADTSLLKPDLESPSAFYADGFGYPAGLSVDIIGNTRSVSVEEGPVDLGAYEFTPNVEPPVVVPNPPPASGGTSTIVLNGINLGEIEWGTGGNLPANVTFQFFPGFFQTEAVKYIFGRWKLNMTGGSGYTYTLKMKTSQQMLGGNLPANLRSAELINGTWAFAGQSSFTANRVNIAGLNRGGMFTLVSAFYTLSAPLQPANGALVNSGVTLRWSALGAGAPLCKDCNQNTKKDDENRAISYNLQVAEDSSFTLQNTYSVSDTFFTVSSLPENVVRYWRVAGVENGFLTGYSDKFMFSVKLNSPGNLQAVSPQYNRVNLTWNDNSSAETGYSLERKNGDSTSSNIYSEVALLPAGTTSFTDTTVSGNSGYTYRIKALSQSNYSDYSNQAQVVTLVPVELASFSGTVSGQEVILNWTTSSEKNNLGFEIERKLNDEWKKIGFMNGHGTTTEISSYSMTDSYKDISFKGSAEYRIRQIDFDGSYSYPGIISVEVDFTPKEYALYQNYPNPFNPSTIVKYALPFESKVNLQVFDLKGELISEPVNEIQNIGYYEVAINAGRLASGMYLYVINASPVSGGENFRQIKKMILMK